MPRRAPFLSLAVDLGAESGRVAAVLLQRQRFSLRVLHRFAHSPAETAAGLQWDLEGLWQGVEQGLNEASLAGLQPSSIGVDGWGVDHVLCDGESRPLQGAYCYRDPRGARGMARLKSQLSAAELYRQSGLPLQPFNTLSQLLAQAQEAPAVLAQAKRLQLLPDHLHQRLSGRSVAEWTNASTTQLANPHTRDWNWSLCARLGLPDEILPPLAEPGTLLGPLRQDLARRYKFPHLQVALPATHDTASAVAAVPASGPGDGWAFISSGTWSLMGLELPAPVLSPAAAAAGLSNEGGVDGTTRLLRNISGLWLLQRLRQELAPGLPYPELMAMAEAAPPLAACFDANHPSLLNPPSMAAAIQELCRPWGPVPQGLGALARAALESLALEYRRSLELLQGASGRSVQRIHIVGGGSQNALLCRMTADACGLPVLAGPVEATALGNALMQARALGALHSLPEAREIVAASFPVTLYPPQPGQAWEAAYHRYTRQKESRPHARA